MPLGIWFLEHAALFVEEDLINHDRLPLSGEQGVGVSKEVFK